MYRFLLHGLKAQVQQTVSAAHLSKVATESSDSYKSDSVISFTPDSESHAVHKSNKSRRSPANGENVTLESTKTFDTSAAGSDGNSSVQEKLTTLSCQEEDSLTSVQSDDLLRSASAVKSNSGQSVGSIKPKSKGSQRTSKVAMEQPKQSESTSNKPVLPSTITNLSTGSITKRSRKKVIPSIKSNEQNDYVGDQFDNVDDALLYIDGSPSEKTTSNKESKKKKKSQKHTTKRVLTETASNCEDKAESSDSFNAAPTKQADVEIEKVIKDVSKDQVLPSKTNKSEQTTDNDSAYMGCESEINDSCNEGSSKSAPVLVKSSGCSSSSSIDEPTITPKLVVEDTELNLTETEQNQPKTSVSKIPEPSAQNTPAIVKPTRCPTKKSTVKAITATMTDSKETKTTAKKTKAKTSSSALSSREEKKKRSKSFKHLESNYLSTEKVSSSQVVCTKVVEVQEYVQPKEFAIEKKCTDTAAICEKEVKENLDISTAEHVSKKMTCEISLSRDVVSKIKEHVETSTKRPAVEMPPGFAAEIHDIQFGFTEQESSAAFFKDPAILSCAASKDTVTEEATVAEKPTDGGTIARENVDFNYEETVAMLRANWNLLMDQIKQDVPGVSFYQPKVTKHS